MNIEKSLIISVLLSDGQWHSVAGQSFRLIDYRMVRSGTLPDRIHDEQGSSWDHNMGFYGQPIVAFAFRSTDGSWVKGPITSVLAVREGTPVVAEGVPVASEDPGESAGPGPSQ